MLVVNKRGTQRNISANQLAEYVAKGYQPVKTEKKAEQPATPTIPPEVTNTPEVVEVTRKKADK